MTGHKDYKLADHYSKLDTEFQQEISEKIMEELRARTKTEPEQYDNVVQLRI